MSNLHKDKRSEIERRTLLVAILVLGTIGGLMSKAAFDHANRPTNEFAQRLHMAEESFEKLHSEFVELNPVSLDGWDRRQASNGRQWLSWEKDGIAYFDKNDDGQPDMKYRESPRMSTTEVWWEDRDFDGTFETEVEQGCFHNVNRPLQPIVNVPVVHPIILPTKK